MQRVTIPSSNPAELGASFVPLCNAPSVSLVITFLLLFSFSADLIKKLHGEEVMKKKLEGNALIDLWRLVVFLKSKSHLVAKVTPGHIRNLTFFINIISLNFASLFSHLHCSIIQSIFSKQFYYA